MAFKNESYIYLPEKSDIFYETLPDKLERLALTNPEREAIISWTPDGKRLSISFSELYKKSVEFGKGLLSLGFERNSIIAISNKNSPEWFICTLGTQMAGMLPLHFAFASFNSETIVNLVNGTGNCVAVIIDQYEIDICKQFIENIDKSVSSSISKKIPTLKATIVMNQFNEKCLGLQEICNIRQSSYLKLPYISPDEVAAIFITSGSTGMPKAVPYTHRKLIHLGNAIGETFYISSGDKLMNYMPFSWAGSYPVEVISNNTTRVTLTDIFSMKTAEEINKLVLRVIEAENCVSAFFLASCMSDLIEKSVSNSNVFPLRAIATGGMPVDVQYGKLIDKWTKRFAVGYGCTEIGAISMITVNSQQKYEPFSAGYPFEGTEIKIVDDEGIVVPKGQKGEIYVRQRERFLGYMNAREKSEQCCDKTGWYRTDDIGFMNSYGCLFVEGRKSDIMIIGGDLVSPSYIEGLLKKHTAVSNAVICSFYDNKAFQYVCAAIVLKNNKSVSEEELKVFITEQKGKYAESFLATRYVPKRIFFFEAFPTTHNGKIDRKSLKEEIKKRL